MEQELKNKILKEVGLLGILFFAALIIFKIVFYNESIFVVLRVVASLYWLFVIPGFCFMYLWQDLRFYERLIIGCVIGLVIMGAVSYYVGILGLHTKYHTVFLPLLIMLPTLAYLYFKKSRDNKNG